MKRLLWYFIELATLFFAGIGIACVFIRCTHSLPETGRVITVENQIASEADVNAKTDAQGDEESPEAKAVRLAEEFVVQNGYTDLPAEKDKIIRETVEFSGNLDELLKFRADTLERKAYGILHKGTGTKMRKEGWTVVFRLKNVPDNYYKYLSQTRGKKLTKDNLPIGRAVTMDANFQNLSIEHKPFSLKNLDEINR